MGPLFEDKRVIVFMLVMLAAAGIYAHHRHQAAVHAVAEAKALEIQHRNLTTNMSAATKAQQAYIAEAKQKYDAEMARNASVVQSYAQKQANTQLELDARKLAEENAKLYPDMYPPTPTPNPTPEPALSATPTPTPNPTP